MTIRRRTRARAARGTAGRSAGSLAAAGVVVLWASCGSAPSRPDSAAAGGPVVVASSAAGANSRLWPAFGTLADAVQAGDDEVAGRVLAWILAQGPEGRSLERARAYQRILAGRRRVAALDLRLVIEPVGEPGRDAARVMGGADEARGEEAPTETGEETPGQGPSGQETGERPSGPQRRDYDLVLVAAQAFGRELVLRPSLPPSLVRVRTTVDSTGLVARELDSRLLADLGELVLPPDETLRVFLRRVTVPVGGELALRDGWSLRMRSGEIADADGSYPATAVRVGACDRTWLSTGAGEGEVGATELARFVEEEAELSVEEVLRRAVRVPARERRDAWEAVAAAAGRLARRRPGQLDVLAPALAWLEESPGTEPRGAESPEPGRPRPDRPRPRLDLPARAAPGGQGGPP